MCWQQLQITYLIFGFIWEQNLEGNTDVVSIVCDFVDKLEGLPYWIIADSYYGSLELAEELNKRQVLFILSCQNLHFSSKISCTSQKVLKEDRQNGALMDK